MIKSNFAMNMTCCCLFLSAEKACFAISINSPIDSPVDCKAPQTSNSLWGFLYPSHFKL